MLCEAASADVFKWKWSTTESNDHPFGATDKTVIELSEGFEGEGHISLMNRYYSSFQLFAYLREREIGACGPIKEKRLRLTDREKDRISVAPQRE